MSNGDMTTSLGWPYTTREQLAPYLERVKIADGQLGTLDTLKIAARLTALSLSDPLFPVYIRRKVLVGGIDPADAPAVFGSAYNYVVANVGFQADPLSDGQEDSISDYVQTPHYTLFVEQAGDCLAMSSLLSAISMALGHGAAFRSIHLDPKDPDRLSHVYALMGYQGNQGPVWLPADATMPSVIPGATFGDTLEGLPGTTPVDLKIADAA
jgi:hypothetical protein